MKTSLKNIVSNHKGMTLLELIIVMVLIGIVSIFITGVMFYEMNLFHSLSNRTDKLQISRDALRMISRDIRQIMAPDSISQAYLNSIQFDDVDDFTIAYTFSNNQIFRNGDLLQNSVQNLEFEYFDSSGNQLTSPVSNPSQIRTISIDLTTSLSNNQSFNLATKIYPRNF
ncbi:prepilin-type N-terminal cleavage/methylation domain-containing protein [candidate division KSB1 bacterium]|nr:prepilin-type N-terminal cleavage/methylation domain-containing protein [candidate division KSB1 bacterium]